MPSCQKFEFLPVGSKETYAVSFRVVRFLIGEDSGGVFPVEIFGNKFVQVIQYLPFIYTTGFPIRVITGSVSGEKIIIGMCVQIVWSLLLWIAVGIVWNSGIKHYSSVGG